MYSLAGMDGKIYKIMTYTALVMKECDFEEEEIERYLSQCFHSTYTELLVLSLEFIHKCNTIKGYERSLHV